MRRLLKSSCCPRFECTHLSDFDGQALTSKYIDQSQSPELPVVGRLISPQNPDSIIHWRPSAACDLAATGIFDYWIPEDAKSYTTRCYPKVVPWIADKCLCAARVRVGRRGASKMKVNLCDCQLTRAEAKHGRSPNEVHGSGLIFSLKLFLNMRNLGLWRWL